MTRQFSKMRVSGLVLAVVLGTGLIQSPASANWTDPAETPDQARYTLSAIRNGDVTLTESKRATVGPSVYFTPAEGYAVVDASLETRMSATSLKFVDLSWDPAPGDTDFTIYRNEETIGKTADSSFRDRDVIAGTTYNYRVSPTSSAEDASGDFGFQVTVPATTALWSAEQVAAAAATTGGSLQVRTFIQQSRVQAPPAGCSYGSSYDFGGDNRTYSALAGTARTALYANFKFDGRGVISSTPNVGQTRVYRRSDGALMATRTAAATGIWAKNASTPASGHVDVRANVAAQNPFCSLGSINGSFILRVTNTASWSFITGSHKQMPNWEVYLINDRASSNWVTLYRKRYLSDICLINFACDSAPFYGSGAYN